jgi:hypothetical protein
VKSAADPTKFASAIVTLAIPIRVSLIPASTLVAIGGQQQFLATVTGTTNTAVNWSVSGAGCSGTSCGSITTKGLYTAPDTVPSPADIKVTAVSQADNTASASATVTIAPSNNAKLTGQYAFLFTGYDASGGVYQAAGSFVADGNGNLSSGLEDINGTSGPSNSLPFAGTYQINAGNRGTMTFTSSLGKATFSIVLDLLGKTGRFIAFDNSGIRGSGILRQQDPSMFDMSFLTGGYAVSLSGADVGGGRIGALGAIFPSGSGFISGSSLDVNDAGNFYPTFGTFSGIYAVDPTGRGTATLLIPGLAGGVFNFAMYVVPVNELILISTDPLRDSNPIWSRQAEAQVGSPYNLTSFSGSSVFNLSGLNGAFSEATIGLMSFDGNGNIRVQTDRNSGGNITMAGSMTGAYSVQLNGRGDLNLVDSTTQVGTNWVMYAIAPNRAFLLDASSSTVAIGEMKAQSLVQPIGNESLVGNFAFASGWPVSSALPLSAGAVMFDGGTSVGGKGTVAGNQDVRTTSAMLSNQVLARTYSVSRTSNNGLGIVTFTTPVPSTWVLWLATETEFFAIDTDTSAVTPTMLFFEQ